MNAPEQLEKILNILAAKFGTSVDHLWSVMVRQGRLTGWLDLTTGVILLILGGLCLWGLLKCLENDEDKLGLEICLFLASLVLIVISMGFFYDVPGELTNPEYWALNKIMSLTSSK